MAQFSGTMGAVLDEADVVDVTMEMDLEGGRGATGARGPPNGTGAILDNLATGVVGPL